MTRDAILDLLHHIGREMGDCFFEDTRWNVTEEQWGRTCVQECQERSSYLWADKEM